MLPDKVLRRIKRRPKRSVWRKPPISLGQVLAWADEHYARTGKWPNVKSGRVRGTFEENWKSIDGSLRQGTRGLTGGGSLARLLACERGVRNPADLPRFSIEQILAWTDAHYQRTGEWPTTYSGEVDDAPGETWMSIGESLRVGRRGLPGGSSLAQLLDRERGVRNKQDLPRITVQHILAWADDFHARTGGWPTDSSEIVPGMEGESWPVVDNALRMGLRGLPGGDSLPKLLARERQVRNNQNLRRFTPQLVLEWADHHYERMGRWPTRDSGAVMVQPDEDWANVAQALHVGLRGLPGGDSLARLLARERGVRNRKGLPPYTVEQILAWADAHRAKFGGWPTGGSGVVDSAPGETWTAVDIALNHGIRGLPGGDSLPRLLARCRGSRNRRDLPAFTARRILEWADAHFQRRGMWPSSTSGPIEDAPGESWQAIERALYSGLRGLPGGSSLFKLLRKHRGVRRHVRRVPLSVEQVLVWADEYHQRTGRWPDANSGTIIDAPGETWGRLQLALRDGRRGLPSGSSLMKLFVEHRRVRSVQHLPRLSVSLILQWIDAYSSCFDRLPNRESGAIEDTPGENWRAVDGALKNGHRGLPGGSSLAQLIASQRRAQALRNSHPR